MEKRFDTTPTLVVKLKNYVTQMSSFLRIGIPLNTVEELSLKKTMLNRCMCYVRHGLETCSPLDLVHVDGLLTSGESGLNSLCILAASFSSVLYCFPYKFPHYYFIDFSQSELEWKISKPLSSDIVINRLLCVDEKFYIFGSTYGVWSGHVFDPASGCWERLSLPIPDEIHEGRFVVASLGKKILTLHVDNQLQFVYDPKLLTWTCVDYKGLLPHFCSILDHPITVEEHNTFYWLDSEANIRAFDYQLCKHYFGSIVGLGHEPIVRGRAPGSAPLLHFKGPLFGIVWMKQKYLHLTLLHVSPGPKARSTYVDDHHLFVNVVSCFQQPIDPGLIVDGAYKL